MTEQIYRTLIENTPDVITRFDRQCRHTYANPITEKEFGISPQAILGKSHRDLGVPSELADFSEDIIHQVFETGQEIVFETSIPTPGGIQYYLSRGVPEFAPDGSIESALFIHRKITQRKLVEQALHDSEESLRQIIQQMPYPVEICDPTGTATLVNDAFLKMFGIPSAELVIGKYNVFNDLVTMKTLGLEEQIRHVYGGETVYIPEVVLPLESIPTEFNPYRKGNIVHEVTMFPVFQGQGEIRQIVTIWKDITGRKRAEEALKQSLREKEILLAELQHRVRNSLATVASLLSVAMGDALDEHARTVLADAQSRIYSISAIYDQLSRKGNFEYVDLQAYIQHLVTELSRSYLSHTRQVQIETHVDEMKLDLKRALPVGIILNELIINALKYGFPQGRSGSIRVSVGNQDGQVWLSVSDDGIGLYPETEQGMGLKLVNMLAEQIGGSFTLENEHGIQARVCFYENNPA